MTGLAEVHFGESGLRGFAVGPEGAPGVVILQEFWGINEVRLQGRQACMGRLELSAALTARPPHARCRRSRRTPRASPPWAIAA
jgi:hypothetical protein